MMAKQNRSESCFYGYFRNFYGIVKYVVDFFFFSYNSFIFIFVYKTNVLNPKSCTIKEIVLFQ